MIRIGSIFWLDPKVVSNDVQQALLVIFAGAIGALIHVFRSFIWHIGNKCFDRAWIPFYLLHPFSGSVLALAVYLIIRGGFLTASPNAGTTNLYSFAALALLVGSFSENAWTKLKQIAETVFAQSDRGSSSDTTAAAKVTPTLEKIEPAGGIIAGGEDVVITGTGFNKDSTVKFGDKSTEVVFEESDGTLKAKTPPVDAAGDVDVVVMNGDKASNAVKFTYS